MRNFFGGAHYEFFGYCCRSVDFSIIKLSIVSTLVLNYLTLFYDSTREFSSKIEFISTNFCSVHF